jgi:hypothetical protein
MRRRGVDGVRPSAISQFGEPGGPVEPAWSRAHAVTWSAMGFSFLMHPRPVEFAHKRETVAVASARQVA